MKVIECFDDVPITGPCKIDRDKMMKNFTLFCRIYEHFNVLSNEKEFTFIENTPKGRRRFRYTISKEDAEWLMQFFELKKFKTLGMGNYVYIP